MRRALLALHVASSAGLASSSVCAAPRSFVYTRESPVLGAGQSELRPWTTFRVGRDRYFSALDGRLAFEHGVGQGLQLALYWNFSSETRDVVTDSLTRELERVSSSELASATAELAYQLGDPSADSVGSALHLAATLGPRRSHLQTRLVLDRSLGRWLFAANAEATLRFEPRRDESGSELETAFVLEPSAAAAYCLPHGISLGLELRAPLGFSGDPESATLFGGPVVRWSDRSAWAALGVAPQLAAFSGKTAGSRLDLSAHERLEVRLLAGLTL